MTKSNLKKYTKPQMEVVAIEYQNLIAVSNIINPNEDPTGPAKGRELEMFESFDSFESFESLESM